MLNSSPGERCTALIVSVHRTEHREFFCEVDGTTEKKIATLYRCGCFTAGNEDGEKICKL